MDTSDVVDLDVVARVRTITASTARRVVVGAVLAGFAGGAVVAAVVYWAYGRFTEAAVLFGAFALLGLWQGVHWTRHYRSIMRQLDVLEQRVARGEVIYGSQYQFHSYR